MKLRVLAAFAGLLAGSAHANQLSKEWTDPNYVPCEGLGLSASGKIKLDVEYTHKDGTPRQEVYDPVDGSYVGSIGGDKPSDTITSVTVRTSYNHVHEPAANLTWTNLGGVHRIYYLVKPWYDTIHSADDKDYVLVGERITPELRNVKPITAQGVQVIHSGATVTLHVTTRFPQDGGNCVSTFSQDFTMP